MRQLSKPQTCFNRSLFEAAWVYVAWVAEVRPTGARPILTHTALDDFALHCSTSSASEDMHVLAWPSALKERAGSCMCGAEIGGGTALMTDCLLAPLLLPNNAHALSAPLLALVCLCVRALSCER